MAKQRHDTGKKSEMIGPSEGKDANQNTTRPTSMRGLDKDKIKTRQGRRHAKDKQDQTE